MNNRILEQDIDNYILFAHAIRYPSRDNRIKHDVNNLIIVTFSEINKILSTDIVSLLIKYHKNYPNITKLFNTDIKRKIRKEKLSLTNNYLSIILNEVFNSDIKKVSTLLERKKISYKYNNDSENFPNLITFILNIINVNVDFNNVLFINLFVYVIILNIKKPNRFNISSIITIFKKVNTMDFNKIITSKIFKSNIEKIPYLNQLLNLNIIKNDSFTIIEYIRKFNNLNIKLYKYKDLLPHIQYTLPVIFQNIAPDLLPYEKFFITHMKNNSMLLNSHKITEEQYQQNIYYYLSELEKVVISSISYTLYGIRLLEDVISYDTIFMKLENMENLKLFFLSLWNVFYAKSDNNIDIVKKTFYNTKHPDSLVLPKIEEKIYEITISDLINKYMLGLNPDKLNILYSFNCSVFNNNITSNVYDNLLYNTAVNHNSSISSSLKKRVTKKRTALNIRPINNNNNNNNGRPKAKKTYFRRFT